MSVIILPMEEAHWAAVRAIHAKGIATGHATFTTEPALSFEEFALGKVACGSLVACVTGDVSGWTTLTRVSSRPVYAGVADVGIYVAASARGRGAGSALMSALIARSEHGGLWTLQAAIFPEN